MAALAQLPAPPKEKTGWPWTIETPPQRYTSSLDWPRITIVTPSYNQGSFLEETIRSVLLQNYPKLEYIVVDGNSQDASGAIIKRYAPYLTQSIIEQDRGQSHAINKGFAQTSGDWCNWLNSDDRLEPDALFHLASAIHHKQPTMLICGHCLIIDQEGRQQGCKALAKMDMGYLLELNHFPQPATFFSRQCLERYPIEEDLHYAMDFRFYLENFSQDQSCQFVPFPIAASREYPETKSQRGGPQLKKERMKVAKELFQTGLLDRSQYQLLMQSIRQRHQQPSFRDRLQSFFQ